MTAENVEKELNKASDKGKIAVYHRFFKLGKGQYAEGDRFIGVTVPKQRIIAKKYQNIPLKEVEKLLESPIHEHRLTALLLLTYRFSKSTSHEQKEIYKFFLSHTSQINNWDLVDISAPHIVGEYLLDHSIAILRKLARSPLLWDRRIAMVSTYTFIRRGRHEECFELAKILLSDQQDLIQKSVGWMLREVGKRCDEKLLTDFLDQYALQMSRTTLRYAIERLSERKRKLYMSLR